MEEDLQAEGRILSKKNTDRIKAAIQMHKDSIKMHTEAMAEMESMLEDCSPKPKEASRIVLDGAKIRVSAE